MAKKNCDQIKEKIAWLLQPSGQFNPNCEIRLSSYSNDKENFWNNYLLELGNVYKRQMQLPPEHEYKEYVIANIDCDPGIGNWTYVFLNKSLECDDLDEIRVTHDLSGNLELYNCNVHKILISSTVKQVYIKNCSIRKLVINGGNVKDLTISDSAIGLLELEEESVSNTEIQGGGLFGLKVPTSDRGNPFYGLVSIDENVCIPSNKVSPSILDSQSCYAVEAHLAKKRKCKLSARFHILGKKLQREEDSRFFANLLSYVHELFSNFDHSLIRPLSWIFVFWLLFTMSYSWLDIAKPTDKAQKVTGWMTVINDQTYQGRIVRASMLSFQDMYNPNGVITNNLLITSDKLWAIVAGGIHGGLSITLLFLFGNSTRKYLSC